VPLSASTCGSAVVFSVKSARTLNVPYPPSNRSTRCVTTPNGTGSALAGRDDDVGLLAGERWHRERDRSQQRSQPAQQGAPARRPHFEQRNHYPALISERLNHSSGSEGACQLLGRDVSVVMKRLSHDTADAVGPHESHPGADLNLFDSARLVFTHRKVVHALPCGGQRLARSPAMSALRR
jgi:hypothetical protein